MANRMPDQILLTVKDLMKIKQTDRYNTARVELRAICDALAKGGSKRYVTIKEYCEFESLPYEEIYAFLTGDAPHPAAGLEPPRDMAA